MPGPCLFDLCIFLFSILVCYFASFKLSSLIIVEDLLVICVAFVYFNSLTPQPACPGVHSSPPFCKLCHNVQLVL